MRTIVVRDGSLELRSDATTLGSDGQLLLVSLAEG